MKTITYNHGPIYICRHLRYNRTPWCKCHCLLLSWLLMQNPVLATSAMTEHHDAMSLLAITMTTYAKPSISQISHDRGCSANRKLSNIHNHHQRALNLSSEIWRGGGERHLYSLVKKTIWANVWDLLVKEWPISDSLRFLCLRHFEVTGKQTGTYPDTRNF